MLLTERKRQPGTGGGSAGPAPVPYAGCRRKNHVQDAIVEAALKIETRLGVEWALALLWDERVPDAVVTRVTAEGPRQLRVKRRVR